MKSALLLVLYRFRRQKLYTALSVFAIVISMFLYTIIGFMISSMNNILLANAEKYGKFHMQISSWSEPLYNEILADESVEKVASNVGIGLLSIKNNFSIHFEEWDTEMYDLMNVKLLSGEHPSSPNEIVLDQTSADYYKANVGDTIKVSLDCISSEGEAIGSIDDDFLVTGIAHNNSALEEISRQSLAIIGHDYIKNNLANYSDFSKNISVRLHDVKSIDNFVVNHSIDELILSKNNTLIAASDINSEDNPLNQVTTPIMIVVVIASVLILVNVFNISYLARVKELSLLRVIGTTNGQAYFTSIFEAILMSLIGIPIGIFLAAFISSSLLPVLFTVLDPDGAIVSSAFYSSSNLFGINPSRIAQAIVITIGTTIISSIVSIFHNRKADPINLFVHVIANKSMKARKIIKNRTGNILSLAKREITRDLKKTFLVIFSITISLALFLCFSSILSNVSVDKRLAEEMPGDLAVYSQPSDGDLIEQWSKIDPLLVNTIATYFDISHYTLRILYTLGDTRVFVIDDERFEMLLENDDKLSKDEFGFIAYTECEENNINVGGRDFKLLSKTDKILPGVDSPYYYYVSESNFRQTDLENTLMRNVFFKTDDSNYTQVYQALKDNFEKNESTSIATFEETKAQMNSEFSATQSVIYSFLFILGMIAALNMINTLYSGAIINTPEYATQRAIGATSLQISLMLIYQALFYAIISIAISIPISTIILLLFSGEESVNFVMYLSVAAITLTVCVLSALPAVYRLVKKPILETILRS